jgi:Ca2+/Na+ antiporter
MAILAMVTAAALIILAVKFGLLRGIDQIANSMNWSAKARGQVTGFATSVPELVCLVAAGLAGVWDAGLWNIASSNIINGFLMLMAVSWYRQWGDLFNRRFADEIGFAVAAVIVPIALMYSGIDQQWFVVPLLAGFFLVYRLIDRTANAVGAEEEGHTAIGNLPFGLLLAATSLVVIAIAGAFLGDATRDVIVQLGVRPALAGWILGFCTSIPELLSFFSVYQTVKASGRLRELGDTQEALDNLTASNMSNVGVVYPLGLTTYLIALAVMGG